MMVRNSWMLDSDLSTLPLPPLLHHLRISITTALPSGTPTSPAAIEKALAPLLASTVALETKAAPYAALLTTLYFTRCAKEDGADAPLHLARRDLAELLACALVARYRADWPSLVDVLTFDFSPRQGIQHTGHPSRAPIHPIHVHPVRPPSVASNSTHASGTQRRPGRSTPSLSSSLSRSMLRGNPTAETPSRQTGQTGQTGQAGQTRQEYYDAVEDARGGDGASYVDVGYGHGGNYEEEYEEEEEEEEEEEDRMSALEVAVLARARRFLSHASVRAVVLAAWRGDISFYASLTDCTHHPYLPLRMATVVNLRRRGPAPFTDILRVSRLRVPRYQHALHLLLYLAFLVLYTRVIQERPEVPGWSEVLMALYALGYAVESLTLLYKSGWRYWRRHLLSVLDVLSLVGLFTYLILRLHAFPTSSIPMMPFSFSHTPREHGPSAPILRVRAFDILALTAIPLYPRAVTLLSRFEGVGRRLAILRAILRPAILYILTLPIAAVGFLEALHALASGRHTRGETGWFLLRTSLGNVDLAFSQASSYHPVYGPWIILIYIIFLSLGAFAGALALINRSYEDAQGRSLERYRYEFALRVLEHVKSASLWPLPPPFNLLHGPLLLIDRLVGPMVYAKISRLILRFLFGWALLGIWVWEGVESLLSMDALSRYGGPQHTPYRPDEEVIIPPTPEDRLGKEIRGLRDRMDRLESKMDRIMTMLEEERRSRSG
ncbi:MAG: hypothetical protein DHS80DRAFT_20970 [Piptocephalis tieghemiana]|nr:MAG: hypothetical protein DHS80DRAFT_20970 [Piptocephalis tieghemiana]